MCFVLRIFLGYCLLFVGSFSLYAQSFDTIPGLFTTYRSENRILWELPESVFGRDMSLITTILEGAMRKRKSADAKFGYMGDRFGPNLLRFERVGDKVFVYQLSSYVSGSLFPITVYEEKERPLQIYEFDIMTSGDGKVLIDVTSWLQKGQLWGVRPFFFLLGVGAEQEAEVLDILGLSDGVIVRSERIYAEMPYMPGTSAGGEQTRWKIGCCLRLLPKEVMPVRYASSRVGYFSIPYWNVDSSHVFLNKDEVIKRWRLEVASKDTFCYNRGGLIEPCHKIVMYVDRQFPRKWWPYILRAVNNWQGVFERCGFKNAIEGRIAPDSVAGMLDHSAYSWIVYKAGPMENAYGRPFIDVRTGEILCCHVAIFHSVFDMLGRWYVAQTGKPLESLSDDTMGKLLEMVVTHEVGHTLGLTHNFYGSSLYDIAELKDLSLMRKNRHGSSIMDYMRLNYVADSADGFSIDDRIPRIGSYDSLAIEWGYRCFPGCSSAEEKRILSEWLDEKQLERKYRFQDESAFYPEAQAEDLGRNSLAAARVGMKKLWMLGIVKVDEKKWGEATCSIEKSHNNAIYNQYVDYLNQAFIYLGGRRKCWGNDSLLMELLPTTIQREALCFLRDYALLDNKMWPLEWREKWAHKVIDGLLSRSCYVADCERSGLGMYDVGSYIEDVTGLFDEISPLSAWGRFLYWYYAEKVKIFAKNEGDKYPEVSSLFCYSLEKLTRNFGKDARNRKLWCKLVDSIIGLK